MQTVLAGGRVNKLGAHPTNNQIYFAASEWGGLYRTTDGGRNWVYVPGHRAQAVWDVKFSPNNPTILVATSRFDGKTTPDSGISVSRDGGTTWTVPPTARPSASDCRFAVDRTEPEAFGIAFDPANANTIYVGTSCGLATSTDAGVTWRYIDPTPAYGGMRVWSVIVHHGVVDICGDEGHLRSTDNAATFIGGGAEPAGLCSLAASPDEGNVIFLSVGTQIFESRDGGATWLGGDNHFVRRSDKHLGRWRELGGGVAAGEFPPPAAPSWPGSTMADRINKRSVHVWNPYYRPTG
ncbi:MULTISPECIES: WD40/YVTN/BNR-like repeat-containing protein [Cupriavidus]|uniref:Glycosyl hydrolase, BNR repeat n=7 Tax=Burkholderiaceae TaxID=119060 RepID=B2AKH2_CUPTR|nr:MULTISPECIES: hypothetical protein [Cupriavidus]CAP63999.1 hypothetical protein, BNR repeat; putative glycosyl trasnferase fragment [Cupriavidus taiwanensis LMG 19424]SPD61631.1 conserved protein of unknown function [Cupriavidus taiwanensis]SPD62339.1 conserved protein of unknown function [Cupriavidus neocaledonicus]SPD69461.1 conserved protein of unknown function [Cupriavidus taiwanensis]